LAYEHKPGTFSLFKNDKGDNERRPDYTGEGLSLDGTPIKVSAWLKQGAKGKFMSCQFQEKTRGEPSKQTEKPASKGSFDDLGSDIPF
jgi:hypothetical protein